MCISHVFTYVGIMITCKIQIYSFKDIYTRDDTLSEIRFTNIMAKMVYEGEVCPKYLIERMLLEL